MQPCELFVLHLLSQNQQLSYTDFLTDCFSQTFSSQPIPELSSSMWEFLNKAAVLNQLMTPEKWAITFIANNLLYRPVQYILPLLLNCVFHAHTPITAFRHPPPKTLPDLVTPLKGHSLSPCRCPATRTAPSERFRY